MQHVGTFDNKHHPFSFFTHQTTVWWTCSKHCFEALKLFQIFCFLGVQQKKALLHHILFWTHEPIYNGILNGEACFRKHNGVDEVRGAKVEL